MVELLDTMAISFEYFPETEHHSMASSFEEGVPDVSDKAHLWGPIRAYWATRESRGAVTVCRRSPRDPQECVSDSTVRKISTVSLVRHRSIFLLCQAHPMTQPWCNSYSFKTLSCLIKGSYHLDDPLHCEAYIRPPIVTLEVTI